MMSEGFGSLISVLHYQCRKACWDLTPVCASLLEMPGKQRKPDMSGYPTLQGPSLHIPSLLTKRNSLLLLTIGVRLYQSHNLAAALNEPAKIR